MSKYADFISTLAKFKLARPDEVISTDRVGLKFTQVGFYTNRVLTFANSIVPLLKEITEHIPYTQTGAQPIILTNHQKINLLFKYMQKYNGVIENQVADGSRVGTDITTAYDYSMKLCDLMATLASPNAPTMAQNIDSVVQSVRYVEKVVTDSIIQKLTTYENTPSLNPKVDPSKATILHSAAALCVSIDTLAINVLFLTVDEAVKAKQPEQLVQLAEQLFALPEHILTFSNDTKQLLQFVSVHMTSQYIPTYSKFIGAYQQFLVNSNDCAAATKSLMQVHTFVNDIIQRQKSKDLLDLVKQFISNFIQKKPLDENLQQAIDILSLLLATAKEENYASARSLYTLSSSIVSNKDFKPDAEFVALIISSICRTVGAIFPDSQISEDVLVLLGNKIADIIKGIFNEARELIVKLVGLVDANLEFFNDEFLGEVNYVLTGAKKILDFLPTDSNFVSQQQLFFDALGSLPTPLSKLISTATDPEVKAQMSQVSEGLTALGNRYGRWLTQFYLAQAAIVQGRAQSICSLLMFPLALLSQLGMQQYLGQALEATRGVSALLGSSPKGALMNIVDVSNLVNLVTDFVPAANQFIEIANRNNESAVFPLFKLATTAAVKVITTLPPHTTQIGDILCVAGNEVFVCSMAAFTSRALSIIQGSQSIIERKDESALAYMSVPMTMALNAISLADKYQPFATPLMTAAASLKAAIQVVWPIVVDIASGKHDIPERENLPIYSVRLIGTLSEMLGAIGKLPQPNLPYKIPDDIQEIKRFDAMADSIHSVLVKNFAKYIVRTLKRSKNSDVRSVMMQWFEATQVQTVEVSEGLARLNKAIMQLITSATTDRSALIESFAALSVSLAATENSYGKTVSPHIQKLHRRLVELVQDLLENTRGSSQALLMLIISLSTQIKALAPISKKKQKEIESYSANIIRGVITQLNNIRTKGKQCTLNDWIAASEALSEFQALSLVAPQELDASPILNAVSGSRIDEKLSSYIEKFAARLTVLEPSQNNQLESIRDSDTVCDFVYDKAEMFRDEVNKINAMNKNKKTATPAAINDSLSKMILYASDAAVLAMHSLMLGGLAFSPISRTLVECFSELTSSLAKFIEVAQRIPTEQKDFAEDLRRVNRNMTKQFDVLITTVENQHRPSTDTGEFETAKNQMYVNLSTFSVQLARLLALSSTALVPEMWTKTRGEIIDDLNADIEQLSQSVSAVRAKAVGASSTELGTLMTRLEQQTPVVVKSSEVLDFQSAFPPIKVLTPIQALSQTLLSIAKVSHTLTDRIIIEPDKNAAARVPARYELPPEVSKSITPSDAYDELELANRQLDQTTVAFRKVTDANLSSSGELLTALSNLEKALNIFVEKAQAMSQTTVEARAQVEQKTKIHALANAFTSIYNAMRSRLLRQQNFADEMEEALMELRNAVEATLRLAADASKLETDDLILEEDGSTDEVTRELLATSRAIEGMASRLSAFETQVDMEDINVDADENNENVNAEIHAEAGTLPAFMIASAKPILEATAKILVRAQEITRSLIERFGKIENEAGMVKVAQDLSEAAELLIICAEILVNGNEIDAEYKVIAAAKIIKAAVASLVAQVLVKGGDAEGIMNMHVKTVVRHTDAVIKRAEKIVDDKLAEADARAPKKIVKNPMIMKLNLQQTVNQQRKQLQEEEKNLYTFRRRGNK